MVNTLMRRDYLVSRSYRLSLLLDAVVGVLNLLIFFFISRTFTSDPAADLAGAPSYFAFAAVGVALSLVVTGASARVALRMREEQLTGTLEALAAQPVTSIEMSLGLAGFHFVFAMGRATLYLVVADIWLGLDFSRAHWPGFILVLLATAVVMLSIGIVLAALVLLFRRAQALIGLATLALTLLGGAYFPITVLPGWLEPLARVVPTRFAYDGMRGALFRGEDWGAPTLVLIGFGALGLPAAVLLFDLSLRLARRRGSLALY